MTPEQAQAKAREIWDHQLSSVEAPIQAYEIITAALLSAEREGYRRGVQAMEKYAEHSQKCHFHWCGIPDCRSSQCTCGLDAAKGGE